MSKRFLFVLLVFVLLTIGATACARDPIEWYDDVPGTLHDPLAGLSSIPYTFVCGFRDIEEDEERAFFVLEQDGDSRLYIFNHSDAGWQSELVSGPLPQIEGAQVKVQGWCNYFWLIYEYDTADGKQASLSYDMYAEGDSWYVGNFQNEQNRNNILYASFFPFYVGMNVEDAEYETVSGILNYDLRFFVFPINEQEIREAITMDGYAMINNPDSKDRLNLRSRPSKDSKSLGKYYNGTIVKTIAEHSGGWVEVDIQGVQGFFMKDFLAYGDAITEVDMPELYMQKSFGEALGDTFPLYTKPDKTSDIIENMTTPGRVFVLGDIGEEWCHVLHGTQAGFVESQYLSFGNG